MDLSKLSEADLEALSSGDMTRLSDGALESISGGAAPAGKTFGEKAMGDLKFIGEQIPRAAGLLGRGAVESLAFLPSLVPDAAIGAKNLATGSQTETTQHALASALDKVVKPENTGEAVLQGVGGITAGMKVPLPIPGGTAPTGARAETVAMARDQGYVIPPTAAGDTGIRRLIEALSGRKALAAEATRRNVPQMNRNLADEIGAQGTKEMTPAVTSAVRAREGGAYENISDLGPSWKQAIEYIKEQRNLAAQYNRQNASNYSVEATRSARAAQGEADRIEKIVETNLQRKGLGDLYDDFVKARTTIAKTHDIDSAMVKSDGTVRAKDFARSFDNDKPLSGATEAIGRVGELAPEAFATNGSRITGLDRIILGSGAGMGAALHSPKIAATAAGVSGAQHLLRQALLSKPSQDMLLLSPEQKANALAEAIARAGIVSGGQ